MKGSTTALKRPEESYEPTFGNDIKSKSHLKDHRIYSLPFGYDKVSDERLVGLYVNNHDEEACNHIVKRYKDIITGFAMKLSGNSHNAEEIKQDVFLILVTKLYTFKGNSKFSTWLYKVTLNTCYTYLNKTNKRVNKEIYIDEYFINQSTTSSNWAKRPDEIALKMKVICNAIDELTESNKAIFNLKDVKGFSNSEVGEFMGFSISAVKSRALRTRLALKEKISDYFRKDISSLD